LRWRSERHSGDEAEKFNRIGMKRADFEQQLRFRSCLIIPLTGGKVKGLTELEIHTMSKIVAAVGFWT
jgi:hypothetical protein